MKASPAQGNLLALTRAFRTLSDLMCEDASFEWLVQQLRQVFKRIEKCEGKVAQLEAMSTSPSLQVPSRRELQSLEQRIERLEERK